MKPYQQQLIELLIPLQPRSIVEVGVERGETSRLLLEAFPDAKLYMVDSWREAPEDSAYRQSGDRCGRTTQGQHYDNLQIVRVMRLAAGWRRCEIVAFPSVEAARLLRPNRFDAVFLDADHTYESVKADLEAWWPRVRDGGILCGHDYCTGRRALAGVKKAVDELFDDRVQVGSGWVWWVKKESGDR